MKFSPGWRKAVLSVHVITSVGWLGTDLVLLTFGIGGLSGAVDAAVVYPAMGLIGVVLFTPLSYLVWLVGVINAVGTPWGLFRYWWVVIKLAINTLMLGLITFLLFPLVSRAWELGEALPARDRLDLVVAPSVSSTLLVIATVLSTTKPWGRVKRQPRPTLVNAERV